MPEEESDDELIVLSVEKYMGLEGLDSGYFEVTVEVRNQLANLLLDSAGTPEYDRNAAVFRAVMTVVANLELKLLEIRSDMNDDKAELLRAKTETEYLRQKTMELYARFLDLQTAMILGGVDIDYPAAEPIAWIMPEEGESGD